MPHFFESRHIRYEIHLKLQKRWQIADILGNEKARQGIFTRTDFESLERDVLGKANALMSVNGIEAVRVMRDRIRDDGFTTTTEIFFKEASNEKSEPPVLVGQYQGETPLCTKAENLYSRESCKVIGAILRSFLDRQIITAPELLHFHPHIRKLNDNYAVLQGAVHQVASAQAKKAGSDLKSRSAELHGFISAVERKARDAVAEKRVPAIEGGDFAKFADRIAARYEGEDRRFYTCFGIARFFQGNQSFLARLDFALDGLASETAPDRRSILEELAASCLDGSQLVMDILGYQPHLAAALTVLSDLARGAGAGDGKGGGAPAEGGTLEKLKTFLASGAVPVIADALWDRILRELQRGRPLSRVDEKQEWHLLMKLSDHLSQHCPPEIKGAIEAACKDRLRRLRDRATA